METTSCLPTEQPIWMKTRNQITPRLKLAFIAVTIIGVVLIFSMVVIPIDGTIARAASSLAVSASALAAVASAATEASAILSAASRRKPDDIKIRGVVFFGRRAHVDILDCYLQRNIVINGGYLDDIVFLEHTKNQEDVDFLTKLVDKVPEYSLIKNPPGYEYSSGYGALYANLRENNTIYVKIDDDMVWVDDNAIPRLVHTLIAHPEAHIVSANIINSATTNWLHYHTGAVLPYLPDIEPPPMGEHTTEWRASSLPQYPHDVNEPYDFTNERNDHSPFDFLLPVGAPGGPPFENHRWLPLPPTSRNLLMTPIVKAEYYEYGRGWYSWSIAAQQLYSLLDNIEHGQLKNYYFGDDGLWDMQYQRLNVNFFAVWGSSIAMELPGGDDELDLSVTIPKKFNRRKYTLHGMIDHAQLTMHSCPRGLAFSRRPFQLHDTTRGPIYRLARQIQSLCERQSLCGGQLQESNTRVLMGLWALHVASNVTNSRCRSISTFAALSDDVSLCPDSFARPCRYYHCAYETTTHIQSSAIDVPAN
jgi:hypothetical protein